MLEDLQLHESPTPQTYAKHGVAAPMPTSLQQLDLSQELLQNYAVAKALLASIITQQGDEYTSTESPNQIAAVINSVKNTLADIIKLQTDVYNADRMRNLEAAMIKALKLAPKEAQDSFFEDYTQILAGKKQYVL